MGTRIKSNPDRVFELFCEIHIPINNSETASISWKYPQVFKDEETLRSIPQFAYPVEFTDQAVHHFSFVLTNVDSKWTFGFCRYAPNYPNCFVILSYLPWHETFYRILNQAAELCNKDKPANSKELNSFLTSLYNVQVPDPGHELYINYDLKDFTITCPDHNKLPSIPENRNMTEYFNAVDANNMMAIFASMLHERRILVISKKLSRLSACVQAANSLIYPMYWQHIFIPVLPRHLLDYLNAPIPFLIGVPTSTFQRMKLTDIGDVVLLDADDNRVDSPFADLDALPTEVLQSLRHDLKRPQEMLGDCVARAFLRASVKLIGGYWNALNLKQGEKISFNPEMFVQTRPAPMQPFLEKILQLQIFQQFIDSRLKMLNSGQGVSDEFEFELTAHEDKASSRFKNQYRDWVFNMKKEGGAFLKNVRKQVKVTSKKAYKDIRSRINEMHHHKMMDESTVHDKRRGSSVPSLFSNGLDFLKTGSSNQKLPSTKDDIKTETNNSNTKSEPSDQTDETFDSSALTFQPIDMDLMGDLHDLIFRRCSLCGDQSLQRTSISDPQLIDFDSSEMRCTGCSSKNSSSKDSDIQSDDTPPPLLPRPPTTMPTSRHRVSRSEKPLIELDAEDIVNRNTVCSDIYSPIREADLNSDNLALTNPFRTMMKNDAKLTNPFQSGPVPSKGPSVKNMVNHIQNTYAATNCNDTSVIKSKFNVPIKTTYRSQPLLRTASTPSGFSVVTPSSVPHSLSTNAVSNNPFISCIDEVGKNNNNMSPKSPNSSWENFQ